MDQVYVILIGTILGGLGRLLLLRVDYRQYPSFPQGYLIHVSMALIAAFLGAVAIPALLHKDFAAATFLALAATQFRDVRRMERDTLANMEPMELVPRGSSYIEGIARVFEARNYLAGWIAVAATGPVLLLRINDTAVSMAVQLLCALFAWLVLHRGGIGPKVRELADIVPATINFDGPLLKVDNVVIMNVGSSKARERYLQDGLAVLIKPKDANAKATLSNVGQRQAIAHDAAALLGIRMDVGEPEYTPLVRQDVETGALALALIPSEKNMAAFIEAVARVPVLEGAVRKPLESVPGKMADGRFNE